MLVNCTESVSAETESTHLAVAHPSNFIFAAGRGDDPSYMPLCLQRLQAPHLRVSLQPYTCSESSVIKDTSKGEKVGAKWGLWNADGIWASSPAVGAELLTECVD